MISVRINFLSNFWPFLHTLVKEGIASLASPIACYILTVTDRILPTVGPVPVALF